MKKENINPVSHSENNMQFPTSPSVSISAKQQQEIEEILKVK